jgi:hypothetical protein
MPSTHPDHHPSPDGPKPKQLRYLRALATNRGQTFTYPRTKAQASAEIGRLEAVPSQDWRDHAVEREQLASTRVPRDDARVRAGEITGYGANARWTHTTDHEDRS